MSYCIMVGCQTDRQSNADISLDASRGEVATTGSRLVDEADDAVGRAADGCAGWSDAASGLDAGRGEFLIIGSLAARLLTLDKGWTSGNFLGPLCAGLHQGRNADIGRAVRRQVAARPLWLLRELFC